MRKPLGILLLLLLLFNTVGYQLVFWLMQRHADTQMQARLDKLRYSNRDLITVKIPINLPYQTDWKDYERIDGEFNYKGNTYRYVKRRVLKDTLILVCINYHEKTNLNKSTAEFYKKVNDTGSTTEKHTFQYWKQVYVATNSLSLFFPNTQEHHFKELVLILKNHNFNWSVDPPPKGRTA
ncbi:hypothetical protein MUY27_03370 [Mucilaginibacter sp. RS28]|uniref:Uncharacterized protein n=1 Tax=Mucilaginibacter straminoryzae TaxID=2932774 RepID=A0A9X1WZZ6_9SPHI|nr:hypothetical protein [Mucilaginibacter straminoryzae]MCJ8208732.1 hypothetical protein [Mucilaginibacter straminoryzae]